MHWAVAILFILGFVAGLSGDWMILVRAYRYGTAWFLGCLFVPCVGWAFASLAMPRPALPLTLSFGGTLLVLLALCLPCLGS
jgi:hypothetical protein